ncbi:MAG: hypothetical protein ABEI86_00710 [Halobacteriaceae archaeon]
MGQEGLVRLRKSARSRSRTTRSPLKYNVPETRSITEFNAHIQEYHPFEPEVKVKEIKDEISFLRDKRGLNGVPQNSIYSISADDFFTMIEAAGIGDEISVFRN